MNFQQIKETLAKSRWLGFIADRHELWLWQRHRVALGAAIGVGIGILIPLAQIPISVFFSFLLRANIGAAATFITNPFTTIPIYVGVFKVGEFLSGESIIYQESAGIIELVSQAGTPLVIGMVTCSIGAFMLTYGLIYAFFGFVRSRQTD
jgi:uncharacterized protein (DUF2062 family)